MGVRSKILERLEDYSVPTQSSPGAERFTVSANLWPRHRYPDGEVVGAYHLLQ